VTPPSQELAEFIAVLILTDHDCSPECLCWELRQNPDISEAMRKIGPKPVSAN
jgi:hypothetical protein